MFHIACLDYDRPNYCGKRPKPDIKLATVYARMIYLHLKVVTYHKIWKTLLQLNVLEIPLSSRRDRNIEILLEGYACASYIN